MNTDRALAGVAALPVVLLLAVLGAAPLSAQTVRTVVSNGPSDELYDMVILGDGYTAADQAQFDQDVLDVIAHFRNDPTKFPYGAYFHLYNVHTVFRASNQRGADKPPLNVFVDTAYDASYWTGGTERCLYIGDTSLATRDAALAPDTDGRVIVLVNDSKYGGCAGSFSVSYNGGLMEDVQAHEWGHSFAGLADEYDYGQSGTYNGAEPGQANITADPTGARKWAPWLGHRGPQGTVGAYQGAGYYQTGLYRPEPDCEMRSLNRSFCTVCREQIIKRFHQECVMFEQPTPSPIAARRGTAVQVSFTNRLAARPHRIEWRVDGGAWQPGGTSFGWNVGSAPAGPHTIEARLTDTSTDVRQDPSRVLEHVHRWTVDVAATFRDLGLREVLPAAAAGTEGDAAAAEPFGRAVPHRAMYGFAAAGARLPDRPVHVRAVAFRADATVGATAGATWDLALDVSTGRNPATALDRTFDRNHGADRVRAHDGPVSIGPETFATAPRPFAVVVPFAEPFAWNPASGPLLLDFRCRGLTAGSPLTVDAVTAAGGVAGRILHGSDPDAAVADTPQTGTDPLGLVAELILDADVSPAGLALAEAPGSTSLGFDYNATQRLMLIHGGTTFATGGRRLVTALSWRPDVGRAWPGNRTIDLRVELSTGASNLPASAVPAFEQNHGPDRTVVFDGPWTPPASPPSGLAPFALRLDLARPFEFDPTRGSLVVDLQVRGVQGGPGAPVDATRTLADVRALWAVGAPNAPTALIDQPWAPLLGCVTVPQPVLPESADGSPGGFALSRPFGVAGATRAMTAYDPAVLGAADPVEITHLSWRAAAGPTGPVTFRARIDLSSGGTLPLGAAFDANHGADRATVFQGEFSAARGPAGAFVVEVVLDTPFRWDPARGPLIVDVQKNADVGGAFGAGLDTVDGSASLSFAAHTTDANATTANRPVATRGQVLRLGGTVPANALVTPYGSGCGGAAVAGSVGLPWLGNRDFRFALFDARAHAPATVLFGLTATATPLASSGLPGCTLLTDTVLGSAAVATDGSGTATSPGSLPNDPSLAGARATTQWAVLDPAGVNGLTLSDGAELVLR